MRQALALTVDREAMVGFVAQGYDTPGDDTPMNAAYHVYQAQPVRKSDVAVAKKLLADAGYTLGYRCPGGIARILDGVDLQIAPVEVVGLVGESGSGKISLAWAIMRALPANARELGGDIALRGKDLRTMNEAAMRRVRGRQIGFVFQNPSAALNPTLTFARPRLGVPRGGPGGGAGRQLHDPPRRDPAPGRRVRLGQVDCGTGNHRSRTIQRSAAS